MQTPQMNAAMDSEALARARYAAYAQRRTMPPRCNPFGILLLVLSLGMLFIGLTMTVIANWPGATSIGENPLRVAGPVLLGCGGALFILAVIVVILLNRYEQSKWERKLTNLAADRVGSSSREILVRREPPSLADEMPYAMKPGRGSKFSGDQEPSSSRGSGAYPVKGRFNVDMLPDPNKRSASEKFHDVSLDSEGNVPDPMRVQKKRPTSRKSGSSNGSFNHSYSSEAGEADLGMPGMLMPSPHRVPQESSYTKTGYLNTSFDGAAERAGAEAKATGREQQKGRTNNGNGRGGGVKQTQAAAADPIRDAVRRGTAQVYSGDQQQLRVHIKAQPGTAVHITPSATPPLARHSHQRPGKTSLDTSGETEI